MVSKSLKVSRIILLIASCLVILTSLMALITPDFFTAHDFQITTGRQWMEFASSDKEVSAYIRGELFEMASFLLALGTTFLVVTIRAYREGARWAWYVILAAGTIASGGDVLSNVYEGNISAGLQAVLLLVIIYAGLAIGAKSVFQARSK